MADQHSGATKSLDAVLESTLDSVDAAENSVLQIAEENGFPEEDLHKIGMSIREAMVNAVVHGNRYNLKKTVHFTIQLDEEWLRVVIVDEGEGFEPSDLPDPLAEENLLRQSGRGLLLMKAFVDDFEMQKAPPRGTMVRLGFRRNRK